VIQGAGGSLTKQGGGTLTLSGLSTYTGATTISNGRLRMGVADAIKPTTSVSVANNAQWDLNGAGKQHVSGSVSFAGGIVDVNLGAGDEILSTGAVSGTSGKVEVHGGAGGFDPNNPYPFLVGSSASGTMTVVGNDMPLLTPTASLSGNSFVLTFLKSGQTMAFLADTANEAAIGAALDPKPLTDPLYKQLATLDTDSLLAALDSMEGDLHASTKSTLVESATYLADAAGGHIHDALGGATSGGADVMPAASMAPKPGPDLWAQAYGHSLSLSDGSGNAALVNSAQGGVLVGLDARAGNGLAGIAGGYSVASLSSPDHSASGNVNAYNAVAYAGGDLGIVRLSGGGSYSFDTIDTTRMIVLPSAQTLTASYNARSAQAFGEIGVGMGAFEPFVGANYINVATDAFQETGGSAALTVASSSEGVAYTTLGVRAEADAGNGLSLRGMAGWRHAYGDVTPVLNATIEGNGFSVDGAPVAVDAFVAEAGVDMKVSNNATVGISYVGQIGANTQDHGAKGTATINF
jgi:autotransporter-associated beta strand protein